MIAGTILSKFLSISENPCVKPSIIYALSSSVSNSDIHLSMFFDVDEREGGAGLGASNFLAGWCCGCARCVLGCST